MPTAYPREFRERAAELARQDGATVAGVSRDLGMAESALRRWINQADTDTGRADGVTTAEKRELVELRRRNRVLEMEVEILKRASA